MYWLVTGILLLGWNEPVQCRDLCPCIVLPGVDWREASVMVPPARRAAEAIFLGTVVAADTLARDSSWLGDDSTSFRRPYIAAKTVRYRFAVERSWKGTVQAETVIMSYDVNTSCGRDYRVGDLYLVYAERDSKTPAGLETYSCSRVKPEGDIKDDLQILGPGRAVKR